MCFSMSGVIRTASTTRSPPCTTRCPTPSNASAAKSPFAQRIDHCTQRSAVIRSGRDRCYLLLVPLADQRRFALSQTLDHAASARRFALVKRQNLSEEEPQLSTKITCSALQHRRCWAINHERAVRVFPQKAGGTVRPRIALQCGSYSARLVHP